MIVHRCVQHLNDPSETIQTDARGMRYSGQPQLPGRAVLQSSEPYCTFADSGGVSTSSHVFSIELNSTPLRSNTYAQTIGDEKREAVGRVAALVLSKVEAA
jgi:hypothetical protein